MVREGPAEPSQPDVAETTEARQARPYGMLFTALVAAAAIVIAIYFVATKAEPTVTFSTHTAVTHLAPCDTRRAAERRSRTIPSRRSGVE
ncbi:hypothetical protein [Bradyrhizobium sp. Ec3.3]|uniref:hypothetical protein n=1 Tax=Bradyrhizobium sp. Ec3.3 TaxID=189753 RepID=UPI000419CF4A|nr:hypothetical protein [Bradyrhizobium sp. Ec3.3]